MENIFFALQTDNQFKRKMQLLAYFNKRDDVITIQRLSDELACSPPTLRSTIRNLQQELPNQFELEYTKREGVRFIHTNDRTIDFAILSLAKKTLTFQIIDNLFQKKNLSLTRLKSKLFVSESVLRNAINHMNVILREFQISISTNHLAFVGKEINIRYFLYLFYSDFKNHFVDYNKEDAACEIYEKLLKFARQQSLLQMHYNYFQAVTWIQIIIQRISSKHFIQLNDDVRMIVTEHNSFSPFLQLFENMFSTMFNDNYQLQEEAMTMYILSLHCIVYSETPSDSFVYRREESKEIIEKTNQFLLQIFPNELFDCERTEKMRAFLINLRLLKYLSPLFEKVSSPLKHYVKEANAKAYFKWCHYLKDERYNFPFPITHYEDLAVSLTLFHSTIFNEMSLTDIVILFSFRGESGYTDYLVQASKLLLPINVKAEYFFCEAITPQVINHKKADLVVCNYNLSDIPNTTCPIIRLSYIPSALEWDKVRNTIHDFI